MTLPHTQDREPVRTERYETVVVGAGQAGLAIGHELAARDVDFTILTDEARIGDNWRSRWGSLRLQTPARFSGLPGMPFPAPPHHLADKDEVADYLERYADRFELSLRRNTRVSTLHADGDRFRLLTDQGSAVLEADTVVVATGPFQVPRVPDVSARLAPAIVQMHSSEYTNPFSLPEGPVLVVGAGNSGAQIALELARFRRVWLSGRPTGHLPRRVLGRDVFDWLWPAMNAATLDTWIGRRLRTSVQDGGDSLIGLTEQRLVQAGVVRVGRLDDARGGLPVCGNDVIDPRVVLWCTGFEQDYRWIARELLDASGAPSHVRGVSTTKPGLYFVGQRFQHRLNSSLIGGVGHDAAYIASQIAERMHVARDIG